MPIFHRLWQIVECVPSQKNIGNIRIGPVPQPNHHPVVATARVPLRLIYLAVMFRSKTCISIVELTLRSILSIQESYSDQKVMFRDNLIAAPNKNFSEFSFGLTSLCRIIIMKTMLAIVLLRL